MNSNLYFNAEKKMQDGVKNIHLGPTLPAFLSPNVANVLVKNFGIAGIGSVDDDLEFFFGQEK